MDENKHQWNFEKLVGTVRQVHEEMAAQAGKAVNLSLTLRNWVIGFYITVYEQNGSDRAEYGARLLENLSSRLVEGGINGFASRSLRQYRQFYLVYPEIWQTPSAKTFESLALSSIRQTLPAKSEASPSSHPSEDLVANVWKEWNPKVVRDVIEPLTDEKRVNVFIIDDTPYERNRSKKVELLSQNYNHCKKVFYRRFRLLTLGFSG